MMEQWERGREKIMQHVAEICIHPEDLAYYNAILQLTTQDPDTKRDGVIEVWTATFPTKPGFEVDIKVVNGDAQAGPYVDPVLFDEGCEVAAGDVADQLDGEHRFTVDDEEFCVRVSPGVSTESN